MKDGKKVIIGLGLVAGLIYVATKAIAAPNYKLAMTSIEGETDFPVITIDPSVDPRSDKITAGEPVILRQYLHNTSGMPMPPWSIAMSVTYPDGTIYDLTEIRRDISDDPEQTWGYVVFSSFVPTFENIYGLKILRTYTVNAELLVDEQVVGKKTVRLIAQPA